MREGGVFDIGKLSVGKAPNSSVTWSSDQVRNSTSGYKNPVKMMDVPEAVLRYLIGSNEGTKIRIVDQFPAMIWGRQTTLWKGKDCVQKFFVNHWG